MEVRWGKIDPSRHTSRRHLVAADPADLYEVDSDAPRLDGAPLLWYFEIGRAHV